jgi:hypothetical protein
LYWGSPIQEGRGGAIVDKLGIGGQRSDKIDEDDGRRKRTKEFTA